MADKVGEAFDGYITGVTPFRPVRRAGGPLRRRPGARLRRWLTTSTGSSRGSHTLFGERSQSGLPARRPRPGADRPRRHGSPADRPGAGAVLDRSGARRSRRTVQEPDASQEGPAQGARPSSGAHGASSGLAGRSARRRRSDDPPRRRHRRPHRPRQEHAGAGAHRHRSRSPEGREGPRHHHRARLRAHHDRRGTRVAFVDVPGHERFVRTMLAGVGGVDFVMLIVAADEIVMPQTREHFDICRLLPCSRRLRGAHQGRRGRRRHARAGRARGRRPGARFVPRGQTACSKCRPGPARGSTVCAAIAGRGGQPSAPAAGSGRRAAADRSRVHDARVRHGRHRHAGVGHGARGR